MRIIFVILLCLVLAYKGPTMAAINQQSRLRSLQDDLLQSCKSYEKFCTENNKLLRNHIELVTNSMAEMAINSCGKLDNQVKKLMADEIELQKQLESKNDQIRQLEKNMKKVEMENMNYKSKEDSMAARQEDLRKQQVIIEQLLKNLFMKEHTEIAQIEAELSSEGEKLLNCNMELEGKRNALVEKDQEINKLHTELKKSVDKLESRNPASCIARDSSGVQNVTLSKGYTFEVLCNSEIAGPGWTVIQQRINGGVDFNRDWEAYRNGFGDFWDGDFFLGLEKINRLTTEQPHELYIHFTRFDGSTFFARYDEFAISGEEDKYRMSKLGKFNGTTTDELRYHKDMRFSTYDQDNDDHDYANCAEYLHAGWWYGTCAASLLNGIYYQTETKNEKSIHWKNLIVLKHVRMMIRPKVASQYN